MVTMLHDQKRIRLILRPFVIEWQPRNHRVKQENLHDHMKKYFKPPKDEQMCIIISRLSLK